MVDPDFELRRGPGFNLRARPAFLPSVTSSFFTQNKGWGGGGGWGDPPEPSSRSATGKVVLQTEKILGDNVESYYG